MERLIKRMTVADVRWNYIWMTLYFIGFGVFLIGMPKYIDDYWYLEHFRGWFACQGIADPDWGGNFFKGGIPWREMVETWEWHYLNDTFRLGNILVVPFLLLPKWVGSSLAFGFWIYAVVGGLRLTGIDVKRSPLVPMCLAVYYVLMPWRFYLGSLDYQFNYLIPSGLLVWLLTRLTREKRGTVWRDILTSILALILGWWHEGFGVPAFCGVVVLLKFKRFRSKAMVLALIGLIIGIIIDMSSPGIRERAGDSTESVGVSVHTIIDLIRSEWMFAIGVVFLIAGLCVRKYRERLATLPWIWSIGAVCVASCGLWIIIQGGDRVGWACGLLSVPFTLGILKVYWPSISESYRWLYAILGAMLMGTVFAGLVMIDAETVRLRKQHSRIMETIALNPEPRVVFEDYKYYREMSPLMLGMPSWSFAGSGMRYLSHYFLGNGEGHKIYCVPKELERVTRESGRTVPGCGGFREVGGKYYAPYYGPFRGQKTMKIEVDFGKGYTNAFCTAGVFKSKADGRHYVFIDPNLGWYVTYFKTIKGLGRLYDAQ